MALQHDTLECRAFARASVHNNMKCIEHSLEFRPEERLGPVRSCIRHLLKKAFHCLALRKANLKCQGEFDVDLHGTDGDCELMAQHNVKCEALGWQNLTVPCRDFTRRFTRHWSIGVLVSSLY